MFTKGYKPAIIWAVIVLILCGIPGKKLPHLSFLDWLRPDKVVHLILFGTQSFLILKGMFVGESFRYKKAALYAFSISCFYGILVEVLQGTVFIDRSADYRDAIANALGAFLGVWIFKKAYRTQNA